MTRVGIVGLGALGSSLGLTLRSQKGWDTVTGYDASARTQNEAKRKGAIREGTSDIPDLLSDAEIVVLAIPPRAVIAFLHDFGPQLHADTVVTDLARTKAAILAAASRLVPPRSGFVGGSPLVHVAPGVANAYAGLYQGVSWRLAAPGATEGQLDSVSRLVEAAGATPYFVDAAEHDAWEAGVDALPQVIATALARVAGQSDALRELARASGPPFADATRLAAAPEGPDIALTNGVALVSWLDRLLLELHDVRAAIAAGQEEAVTQFFAEATTAQERWDQAVAEQRRP